MACLDHFCINSRLCSLKNHYMFVGKANVPVFVVLILSKQIAYWLTPNHDKTNNIACEPSE